MDLEIDDNPTCHAPVWFLVLDSHKYLYKLITINKHQKERGCNIWN